MSPVSEQTHRDRITTDHPGTSRVNQPNREAGIVRADSHPVEHERPEEWGWHGETGRAGRIGAWIVVLFTFSYLIGNHEGRIEDIWVVGIAVGMIVILIADWRRRKNAWRAK